MIPMHTGACPTCVTRETSFIKPSRIVDADGIHTEYAYKCPDCSQEWRETIMNDEAHDLPEGHSKIRESGE